MPPNNSFDFNSPSNPGKGFDQGFNPNVSGGGGGGKKPKRNKGYTVQSGDSFASIAQKLYGDQRYFNVIADLIGGGTLQAGMVLKAPDLSGYMKDLAEKGQKHLVTPGQATAYGMSGGSSQVSSASPTTQTPATVQPDPMSTWLANNPAQTAATPYVSTPSGAPPVGYGPNAWAAPATPTTQTRTNNPALNYAALAARGTRPQAPLNPDGSFNLAAMPAYQAPATGRRATQPVGRTNFTAPPPPPVPPTQLTGIAPLQQPNPAQPGAATGYYTGVGLQPYAPSVRTGGARGQSQAGRNLPRQEISQVPKAPPPPTYIYNTWGEGPPPPEGYAAPPILDPFAGGGGGGYPYPTGGGGGGGGGGGNDPGGYTGRGVPRRQPQPFYAQTSNTPGGYRSPQRAANSLTRTGLVTWRL